MKQSLPIAALALVALLAAGTATSLHADSMSDMPGMGGGDMQGMTEEAPTDTGMAPLTLGQLTIASGFVKGMLPGQAVAGGYVTITNNGTSDDRLVSLSSPMAAEVDIHEMSMENDVMKMRKLPDGLVIPAGKTIVMKPGGFHLMFMGVKNPVRTGASVKVTFKFEKAGEIEGVVPVIDPRTAKAKGQ